MECMSKISITKKLTHCVSSFIDRNTAVYFDSFGTEYIPKEVLNKIREKSITHNILRIQDDDSIMCGFCCILRRNMSSLKFRLKKTDEKRISFIEKIKNNDLMNEKWKKPCKY